MHFDQHIQADVHRFAVQRQQRCVVERGHDQQDAVGAEHARFHDLVGIDGEILAQHRQRAGGARLLQVGVGALEEIDIGQHRQTGCASGFVTARDRGGIEILTDHTLRRTGLLDLGDHRRLAKRPLRFDRRDETTGRRRLREPGAQCVQRHARAARRDFFDFAVEDALQDIRASGVGVFVVHAVGHGILANQS